MANPNEEDSQVMPPASKGKLPAAELALLRTWIEEGAVWEEVAQETKSEPKEETPSLSFGAKFGISGLLPSRGHPSSDRFDLGKWDEPLFLVVHWQASGRLCRVLFGAGSIVFRAGGHDGMVACRDDGLSIVESGLRASQERHVSFGIDGWVFQLPFSVGSSWLWHCSLVAPRSGHGFGKSGYSCLSDWFLG